jgi:hypothetical protein
MNDGKTHLTGQLATLRTEETSGLAGGDHLSAVKVACRRLACLLQFSFVVGTRIVRRMCVLVIVLTLDLIESSLL